MNNTEDMKMACSKEIYLSREACLKRWIQDYAAAIVQTCMYLTPDREKAEAAVQNTLIKAWRYLGNGKNRRMSNERAWLLKIAVNTCKDALRGEGEPYADRQLVLEDPPPRLLRIVPEDGSIVFMVMDLPEKARQTMLLYSFQGLNQQEIAEFLGIPISTVNRRLRSAEEILRKEYEE